MVEADSDELEESDISDLEIYILLLESFELFVQRLRRENQRSQWSQSC